MREYYYYNYDLIGEFWSVGRLVDSLSVCVRKNGRGSECSVLVYGLVWLGELERAFLGDHGGWGWVMVREKVYGSDSVVQLWLGVCFGFLGLLNGACVFGGRGKSSRYTNGLCKCARGT